MIRLFLITSFLVAFNANAFFFGEDIDFKIRIIGIKEATSIMERSSFPATYRKLSNPKPTYQYGMYTLYDKILIPYKPINLSKETLTRIKNTEFSCIGTLSVGSYGKDIRFFSGDTINFKDQSFTLRSYHPVSEYELSDYDKLSISCEPVYDEDEDITLNVEVEL